jgi:glucose-6-phosphate 1-epimerase
MPSPLVRTALPPTVSLEAGEGGLPRLAVANAMARALVYLHGAHVAAWQPVGHEPVLWMSRHSSWAAAKPIRGGVPICFPWFGPHATEKGAPGHGFARLLDWTLVASWPHACAAAYHVTVGASLELALEIRNTGTEPFTFEEALHTYFAVQDVRTIEISGLAGSDYLDKVGGTTLRNQGPAPIRFTSETDRVYVNTQAACTIHDSGARRRIVVRKSRSNATVVWNPWVDKARAMPDFGDDEWPQMVCVETGNVNVHAVTLAAGASHTMTAAIDVAAIA